MRVLRIAAVVCAAAAILAAPVSAAPATPGDSVGGVGVRLSGNRVQYTVSVKGGPSGPIGSFLYRAIDFRLTFGGTATCFDIDGNQAAVGGWITHVQGNPDLRGQAYLVFFEDNGPSGDIVSQTYILPDDGGLVDVPGDFPDTCPDAATTAHDAYDVLGNFVVSDR